MLRWQQHLSLAIFFFTSTSTSSPVSVYYPFIIRSWLQESPQSGVRDAAAMTPPLMLPLQLIGRLSAPLPTHTHPAPSIRVFWIFIFMPADCVPSSRRRPRKPCDRLVNAGSWEVRSKTCAKKPMLCLERWHIFLDRLAAYQEARYYHKRQSLAIGWKLNKDRKCILQLNTIKACEISISETAVRI